VSDAATRGWLRVREFLQRRKVRWVLSVCMTVVVLGAMLPFIGASLRIESRREAIMAVLRDANLSERDADSVALLERGEVTAQGQLYASPRLKQIGADLFDRQGRVLDVSMVAEVFLLPSFPEWAPTFLVENPLTPVLSTAAVLASGIAAIWMGLLPGYLLVLMLAGSVAVAGILTDRPAAAFVASGMAGLVISFVLLMRLLLMVLGGRRGWMAVAQTVVREAVRLRISLGFIVVVLVVLPLIPIFIDPRSPLRYQIQTFMSRALDLAYVCSACMTLTLGCATVAFEIRDRQIWQLLTKPLARLQYLLGKWAGIVGLNAVLLLVCGVGIFLFVQWMRLRPAMDDLDRLAVRDEVLVARQSTMPPYEPLSREALVAAVDAAVSADATLKGDIDAGRRRLEDVRREVGGERQKEHLASQRSVAAGQSRTLEFSGLKDAKRPGDTVTLRFLLHAGASDSHSVYPIVFRFKDGSWIDRKFVPAPSSVLPLPTDLIDDDGKLSVEFMNLAFDNAAKTFVSGPYTFNWDADAVEVLYRVGGFEANYLRAMTLNLVKLSFLGMLAVCSATFLSFPVACLLSFAIFLGGSLTPFLAESLKYQTLDLGDGVIGQSVTFAVYALAIGIEYVLRPFGQISANESLVRGLNVSWQRVGEALAVIGVVWTGIALLTGWLAFRRKELAIYSGQG
jgi:ABC-type transport system involved in multi-copper enzyme maturation permease subunit